MNHNEKRELELQRKYWDKYRETVRNRWNQKAVDRMMATGAKWKAFFPHNLHSDMQENIQTLQAKIQQEPLSNEEQRFADAFMNKDFFIVHASKTNLINNGNLLFYSRKQLEEKRIKFPNYHTSTGDLGRLGNDDYVFFSLEPGNNLQKVYSRFGTHFYRIPYKRENVALRHSSMVLFDQLRLASAAHDSNLLKNMISSIARRSLKDRVFEAHGICFSGFDNCLQGLLYSIILEARQLDRWGQNDAQKIFSARSDDEMNRVINGLFRPEIRVPKMLGICAGGYQAIMNKRDYTPY